MCPRTPKMPAPPPPPPEQMEQVAPERKKRDTSTRSGGTGAYRTQRRTGAEAAVGYSGGNMSSLSIGGR